MLQLNSVDSKLSTVVYEGAEVGMEIIAVMASLYVNMAGEVVPGL